MKQIKTTLKTLFTEPHKDLWFDFKNAFDALINKPDSKPGIVWLLSMTGLLCTWMVYVPIHELMHVAGCLITGGSVSELRMDPLYGATYLKKLFPFIVPTMNSEYAGRLTGFSTHGSDFIYLSTVFFPFLLTVLFGALMLRLAWQKKSCLLFGSSLVIAGAPLISLTGDYLEMGSIIGTNILSFWEHDNLFRFRSDDLFRLFLEMYQEPIVFGLTSFTGIIHATIILINSLSIGIVLAGWTYALSRKMSFFFIPPRNTQQKTD